MLDGVYACSPIHEIARLICEVSFIFAFTFRFTSYVLQVQSSILFLVGLFLVFCHLNTNISTNIFYAVFLRIMSAVCPIDFIIFHSITLLML